MTESCFYNLRSVLSVGPQHYMEIDLETQIDADSEKQFFFVLISRSLRHNLHTALGQSRTKKSAVVLEAAIC